VVALVSDPPPQQISGNSEAKYYTMSQWPDGETCIAPGSARKARTLVAFGALSGARTPKFPRAAPDIPARSADTVGRSRSQ